MNTERELLDRMATCLLKAKRSIRFGSDPNSPQAKAYWEADSLLTEYASFCSRDALPPATAVNTAEPAGYVDVSYARTTNGSHVHALMCKEKLEIGTALYTSPPASASMSAGVTDKEREWLADEWLGQQEGDGLTDSNFSIVKRAFLAGLTTGIERARANTRAGVDDPSNLDPPEPIYQGADDEPESPDSGASEQPSHEYIYQQVCEWVAAVAANGALLGPAQIALRTIIGALPSAGDQAVAQPVTTAGCANPHHAAPADAIGYVSADDFARIGTRGYVSAIVWAPWCDGKDAYDTIPLYTRAQDAAGKGVEAVAFRFAAPGWAGPWHIGSGPHPDMLSTKSDREWIEYAYPAKPAQVGQKYREPNINDVHSAAVDRCFSDDRDPPFDRELLDFLKAIGAVVPAQDGGT